MVLPEYPAVALQKNIHGRVAVKAVITKDGTLRDIRFVGPPSVLNAAVLESLRKWRYHPRSENGALVDVETEITIDFTRYLPVRGTSFKLLH